MWGQRIPNSAVAVRYHPLRMGWTYVCIVLALAISASASIAQDLPDDIVRLSPVHDFTGYTWIAESWTELIEAQAAVFEYSAGGYESFILPAQVGGEMRYRVAFGKFGTKEDAVRYRPELPPDIRLDAWLVEIEAPEPDVVVQQIDVARVPTAAVERLSGDIIWNAKVLGQRIEESPPDPPTVTRSSSAGEKPPSFLNRYVTERSRVEIGLLSQFESNIDRAENGTSSIGYIPALFVRYEIGTSRPIVYLNYYGARHDFSKVDGWDRWSHILNATALLTRRRRLRNETTLQFSRTTLTEERELSDDVQVRQRFEYRFSRNNRLRLYGTARWERYSDDPEGNAFRPNAGMMFRHIRSNGNYWWAETRYETNTTSSERDHYKRFTFVAGYEFSLSTSDDMELEVVHRRRLYDHRFVRIDDTDVPRRDVRWGVGVSWVRQIGGSLRLLTGYHLDRRRSNDVARKFNAHSLDLGLVYSL